MSCSLAVVGCSPWLYYVSKCVGQAVLVPGDNSFTDKYASIFRFKVSRVRDLLFFKNHLPYVEDTFVLHLGYVLLMQ